MEEEGIIEEKTLTRRERRREKIKNKILSQKDIKYVGPFSYRVLRIIAWIAIAASSIILLNSMSVRFFNWDAIGEPGNQILSFLPPLSFPLFIIASFGLILSGRRGYRNMLLAYGGAYFAIGFGFVIFYFRYVKGMFDHFGVSVSVLDFIPMEFANKLTLNVFADLFAFALFHFFVNYSPKRFFKGKSVIIFRLGALIPIIFVITSYILEILIKESYIVIPLYFLLFFTTKSPLIFFMFAMISLWIKHRERLSSRFGVTNEEYRGYLLTRRSSLHVSLNLSLYIILFSILEFILLVTVMVIYYLTKGKDFSSYEYINGVFGLNECSKLIFAIPIILLYSFNRNTKNQTIDVVIPIAGIGLNVLVLVEGFYQFIINIA